MAACEEAQAQAHVAGAPEAGDAAWRACKAGLTAAYNEVAVTTAGELAEVMAVSLTPSQAREFGEVPTAVWELATA